MRLTEYRNYVLSDLYRYTGQKKMKPLFANLLCNPGFKYTFLMRSAAYLKSKGLPALPAYFLVRLTLNRCKYRYGINVPYNTSIGHGLYIGHFGGIVVNHEVKIGNNCNINQDVSIGAGYGGKHPGTPVIGDNVYMGPGCKVFGGITIGNGAAIGANCVVTDSVPDNGVVTGVPGKLISYRGSGNYVINKNPIEPKAGP
jgi:serine O-acetyltransferase